MGNARQTRRWSGLFRKGMTFAEEVASAREIDAQWMLGCDGKQLDVVMEPIAGYMNPAWGSDSHWLYLLRPGGVWKIRLPQDGVGEWIMLCQRGGGSTLGSMSFKISMLGEGGWHWNDEGPWTTRELDELRLPVAGCPGAATEMWEPLWDVLEVGEGRVLMNAGEAFCGESLSFSRSGDWLLVADVPTGRTVAFDTAKSKAAKRALDEGVLWLRFQGPWMLSRDVHVVIDTMAV